MKGGIMLNLSWIYLVPQNRAPQKSESQRQEKNKPIREVNMVVHSAHFFSSTLYVPFLKFYALLLSKLIGSWRSTKLIKLPSENGPFALQGYRNWSPEWFDVRGFHWICPFFLLCEPFAPSWARKSGKKLVKSEFCCQKSESQRQEKWESTYNMKPEKWAERAIMFTSLILTSGDDHDKLLWRD